MRVGIKLEQDLARDIHGRPIAYMVLELNTGAHRRLELPHQLDAVTDGKCHAAGAERVAKDRSGKGDCAHDSCRHGVEPEYHPRHHDEQVIKLSRVRIHGAVEVFLKRILARVRVMYELPK